MNSCIRRRALRATAKVALGLTVGCGSQVSTTSEEIVEEEPTYPSEPADPGDYSPPKDEGGYAASPYVPTPIEEELMCNAPAEGEEVVLDTEQLTCCNDELGPRTPETNEDWEQWMSGDDAGLLACCGVIIAHVDADWAVVNDTVSWDLLNACCGATEFASLACTPWGPPPPPAVLGELPELDFGDSLSLVA